MKNRTTEQVLNFTFRHLEKVLHEDIADRETANNREGATFHRADNLLSREVARINCMEKMVK